MRSLSSIRRVRAIVVVLALWSFGITAPARAQKPLATLSPVAEASFTNASIGQQLGAKVSDKPDQPMALGASVTGVLRDPSALARLGIDGMHKGARVAAMRFAPDKIRVEVDELIPAPRKAAATLRVNEAGELSSLK